MRSKFNKVALYLGAMALAFTSCEKSLNINENPNTPTSATPELVLPTTIVATGNSVPAQSSYGSQIIGYYANGGGVSGWGSIISYNFTTSSFTGLWSTAYNILNDLEYVIKSTPETQEHLKYAAMILKAYHFEQLVNTYNDVPYTEALLGAENLTPSYDKAEDIYKSIGGLLDESIAYFKVASNASYFTAADKMMKGDVKRWAQLANTLKLRLQLKAGNKVAFDKTALDNVGFLTDDAIVNPGYARVDGKLNPTYSTWAYNAAGTAVGSASQYAPTYYILAFFDGGKIADETRAKLFYKTGLSIPKNQLGYQQSDAGRGQPPSSWYLGTSATVYDGKGILKGPAAGQPLLLASESYFLQAEAVVRGLITGDAKALFENGIKASYTYLNKNESDAATTTAANADTYLTAYKAENNTVRLVNFDLATTNEQKIEAIITQKYIAANMMFGHESWNEYRRTGYPANTGVPSAATRTTNFVSTASEATTADKLPTRILYPSTEYNYNPNNIPADIDKYKSKIFWAK